MRYTIALLMLLFIVSNVLALGVSPADTRLTFEPNMNRNYTIRIVNDGRANGSITLGIEGDKFNLVRLYNATIRLRPEILNYPVRFNVRLPAIMEEGEHTIRIRALMDLGGGGISTAVALNHRIILSVPAEFARVTAKLSAEPGLLRVLIKNPKEEAESVGIEIELLESNKPVFSYSNRSIHLPGISEKMLELPLGFSREGEFLARHTITQAQENFSKEETLLIGSPAPKISASLPNPIVGRIIPVDVDIENNWNKQFPSRLEARAFRPNAGEVRAVSEDFQLPAYGSKRVRIFLDATNIDSGTYTLELTLRFGENTKKFSEEVELGSPSPQTFVSTRGIHPALIAAFAIIIASLLVLFWLRKRR